MYAALVQKGPSKMNRKKQVNNEKEHFYHKMKERIIE